MSHALDVARTPDDTITIKGENDSGIYYGIGKSITVKWRGSRDGPERQYVCLTCCVNACEHTRRIDRYRGENFA
jgi:hypothetical protein